MTSVQAVATRDDERLMAHLSGPEGGDFGEALALAGQAIQIWDADGRLVMSNPAATEVFGEPLSPNPHHVEIFVNALRTDGSPFPQSELPVNLILESGQALDGLLMLIPQNGHGGMHWLKISGRPLVDAQQHRIGAVLAATDITEFIEHRQHLEHLANYDTLTQLPNRILLAERMQLSLARAQRMGHQVAICMLDLDGFKPVNDSLGHKAGDELLRDVALMLQKAIRADDTVARIGGDEFAILLCDLHRASECEQTLTRILTRLSQPFQIAGQSVRIGASAGIALFPDDGCDGDVLLNRADMALYQAKEAGKNRFHFFDSKLDMRLQANRGLLRKIEKALRDGQFALYYQPIIDCKTGRVDSAEALIRWHHPILGTLAPSEFIALIERDDLIIPLGEWAIGEVLSQLSSWHESGIELAVSVNVAAHHFLHAGFIDWLSQELARHPAAAGSNLRLDISESAAMENISAASELMHQCRKLGIRVAMDHFGVGFASLQHLKLLTTDTIKLDQSFIQNMLDDPADLAIVGGVIGFAEPFGSQVVATGAETMDHLLTLLEMGCSLIQGHSVARPMSATKMQAWLHNFKPDPLWQLSLSTLPSRDHFELLLAEANHRAWTRQAIAQCHTRHGAEGLADYSECPFGLWLDKPATQHLRKYPEFREITELHRGIHMRVSSIGQAHHSGNSAEAEAEEARLIQDHQKLLSLMRFLRTRLGRKTRSPSSPQLISTETHNQS